jgi:hypothetical protein
MMTLYGQQLIRGAAVSRWATTMRTVDQQHGTDVSEQTKLLALNKILHQGNDPALIKQIDEHGPIIEAKTAEALISAVETLFKPDVANLNKQLASLFQTPGQTAVQFTKTLKEVHVRFWAPLPMEATQVHALIMKFQGAARTYIELQYNIQVQVKPIDFGNLERWAQEADDQRIRDNAAPMQTRSMSRQPSPHRSTSAQSHPQTGGSTQVAAAEASIGQVQGKGKGKGKGKGQGQGQGQGKAGASSDPGTFSRLELEANSIQAIPDPPTNRFAAFSPELQADIRAIVGEPRDYGVGTLEADDFMFYDDFSTNVEGSRETKTLLRQAELKVPQDATTVVAGGSTTAKTAPVIVARPAPVSAPKFGCRIPFTAGQTSTFAKFVPTNKWKPHKPPAKQPYHRSPPTIIHSGGGNRVKQTFADRWVKQTFADRCKPSNMSKETPNSRQTHQEVFKRLTLGTDLPFTPVTSDPTAQDMSVNKGAGQGNSNLAPVVGMMSALGPLAGSIHHHDVPNMVEVAAARAAPPQHTGNRRPRGAEPHLPQEDTPQASSRVRAPVPYGPSAEDRFASAMISLSLGHIASLTQNPKFLPLMEKLQDFLSSDPSSAGPALLAISLAVDKISETLGVPSANTERVVRNPNETPAEVFSVNEHAQAIAASAAEPSCSVLLHSPTVTFPSTEATAYAAAANASPQLLHQATATMPKVEMGFYNPDLRVQVKGLSAALDSGCNICMVSEKALKRDWAALTRYGTVHDLKPFTIQMADQTITSTQKAVQGARIVIGSAWYEVDLLVAPTLAHDYILGFGFQLVYNAQLKPQQAIMTIGVHEGTWVSDRKPYRPYQHVPMHFSSKATPFVISLKSG